MYDQVLRETNEDMIENMDFIDADAPFENHFPEIDRSRGHANESHFETSNPHQTEANNAGLFNQSSELNAGEARRGVISTAGYFDNAQDEATGGEGHNYDIFEEERTNA